MEANPRHELKYLISAQDASLLKGRISSLLTVDENSTDPSGYLVTSLYYDTHNFSFAREKEDGLEERVKYRIRTYGDEGASFQLERKAKRGNLCFKTSCALVSPWENPVHSPLASFFSYRRTGALKPAVIVRYRRKAFCSALSRIRVTFDHDLSALRAREGFPRNEGISVPVLPDGMVILEIKYDEYLPAHIGLALRLSARPQLSLSKYLLCLKAVGI